ncbi:MAG: MBL fold metallo-hydrolase [Ruminococcaceae bacterium]|nr:MBL fold metallo-hydrolase [Oscillospiraceae bacterium]
MPRFESLTDHIFRLRVPFMSVYTTVFLIRTPAGDAIVDAATTDSDVEAYILPALDEAGVTNVRCLIASHNHSDHAGGIPRLAKAFPDADLIALAVGRRPSDGELLLDHLEIVHLPGHCADALGVFDRRSDALISCDCLQLYGLGCFGTGVSLPERYLESLDKLASRRIAHIFAAHDYHPLGFRADGDEEVARYLAVCREALLCIAATIAKNPTLDDAAVAEFYNKTTGLPTISAATVGKVRETEALFL